MGDYKSDTGGGIDSNYQQTKIQNIIAHNPKCKT